MKPVGPNEFNPVLGGVAIGMGVVAVATFGIIRWIRDASFIRNQLVSECEKVLRLSEQTRDLLIKTAGTFQRTELQLARERLVEQAHNTHRRFVANFEPREFSAAVREAQAAGERPKDLMWRWCSEITAEPLWLMDKIQSVRMSGREHRPEWRKLESLKQEIVNLWGREGFEVSRWEGREHSYLIRQVLRPFATCAGALALALYVLGVLASP